MIINAFHFLMLLSFNARQADRGMIHKTLTA